MIRFMATKVRIKMYLYKPVAGYFLLKPQYSNGWAKRSARRNCMFLAEAFACC
jgi:hypothetical protein